MFEPVTEEQLTRPRGNIYVQVIEGAWWPHDAEGNFFFHRMNAKSKHVSPQCNSNEVIAYGIGEKIIPGFAGVKWIELAFVPIDVSDF